MTKPEINVTPLIDVLLVLLIIFMVVAPLKPSSFKMRVPQESKDPGKAAEHPQALVAVLETDGSLSLNMESGLGTSDEPSKLIERLRMVFEQRIASGDLSESFANDADRPNNDHIERMVFIKAPRSTGYGEVAKVVDAVKSAGAYPISLQIDYLR